MKKTFLSLLFILLPTLLLAQIPSGYYSSIDGKNGTDIKKALCTRITSGHKVLGYNSLWKYYPNTYYHLDNKSQVLDMYSNIKRYYDGAGSAVDGMNKEHTVPKSWWGGSTSAAQGNDLFNVIPSDESANSRKSNYPLGKVSSQSWTNGVTTIGTGTVSGNGSSYTGSVFEPCDKYKGDFARIYFYMATRYPDISWDKGNSVAFANSSTTLLTLKPWIIPLLLEWAKNDPVDAAEIQRNEDIYKVQGNRNPFIDYPVLIDYIWGDKRAEAFILSEHKPNEGTASDPEVHKPIFSPAGGNTASAPYDVARGTVITIKGGCERCVLHTRMDDGEWKETKPTKGYNSTTQTEYYTTAKTEYTIFDIDCIEAYCTHDDGTQGETVASYYKAVVFDAKYLLHEAFDEVKAGNNTDNNGSSSKWDGNSNFPTVERAYQAGNAIKLGSGSASGSIVSRPLITTGGTLNVDIDVKGWTTIEGALQVSLTGADDKVVNYTAKMEDNFETVHLTFNNVTSNPKLTIATTSKRAFVDNIKVTAPSATDINQHTLSTTPIYIYNVAGLRTSAQKAVGGMYIVNGKKFVIR